MSFLDTLKDGFDRVLDGIIDERFPPSNTPEKIPPTGQTFEPADKVQKDQQSSSTNNNLVIGGLVAVGTLALIVVVVRNIK